MNKAIFTILSLTIFCLCSCTCLKPTKKRGEVARPKNTSMSQKNPQRKLAFFNLDFGVNELIKSIEQVIKEQSIVRASFENFTYSIEQYVSSQPDNAHKERLAQQASEVINEVDNLNEMSEQAETNVKSALIKVKDFMGIEDLDSSAEEN